MGGEIASTLRRGAAALRAALVLAALCAVAPLLADEGPGGSTWLGTDLNAFTGAATGYESVWFRGMYLAWQRDGFDLPPLVTTNPPGTAIVDSGRLDTPSTTILAGDFTAGDHWRSGYAFDGGYWLNPYNGTAITADYFNGGRDSYGFRAGGDEQILAQPFFNAETGVQDAVLVNFPTDRIGTVGVQAWDDFHGAGAALQTCIWSSENPWTSCDGAQLSLFGGYRYYHHDSVVITDSDFTFVENNPSMVDAGTRVLIRNVFAARNEFHGAELGLSGRIQRGNFWADGLAGFALGGNRRIAFINGGTLQLVPGFTPFFEEGGGVVSSITNFGRYKNKVAEVIPRLRIGAGWQVTEHISARAGYNLIVWDGVVQAANGLPPGLAVDQRNLPNVVPGGGPEPIFPGLRGTTMVAHGLDLGLEVWF